MPWGAKHIKNREEKKNKQIFKKKIQKNCMNIINIEYKNEDLSPFRPS